MNQNILAPRAGIERKPLPPQPTASGTGSGAGAGAAAPANSIYDRNLLKNSYDINMSSLSFLFCEIVNWVHSNSKGLAELESKLNHLGYSIGIKYLELINYRENYIHHLNSGSNKQAQYANGHRENVKLIDLLQFIHSKLWKSLFGTVASNLERSSDVANEYMITDDTPLFSKFISVPKDFQDLNCSAFVAGILEGVLDSSYFQAQVSAHSVPMDGFPCKTVYLIKFEPGVLKRESLRGI